MSDTGDAWTHIWGVGMAPASGEGAGSPMHGPTDGSEYDVLQGEGGDEPLPMTPLHAEGGDEPLPMSPGLCMTPGFIDEFVSHKHIEVYRGPWTPPPASPKPSTPPSQPKPSTPPRPPKQGGGRGAAWKRGAVWRFAWRRSIFKVINAAAAATPTSSITPGTRDTMVRPRQILTPMPTIASGSGPSIASVSMPSKTDFMFLWRTIMDNSVDQKTDQGLDNAITTGASLFFNSDFEMYKQHTRNTVANINILKSFPGNVFANLVMKTDWYS
jgi:hypothetical protein